MIDYYAQAEGAAITNLSNTILEIRRERVTELILENLRVDDLYRWHCANLIALRDTEKGWKGVYLSADEVKNGMEFNGYTYTFTAADTTAITVIWYTTKIYVSTSECTCVRFLLRHCH